MKREEELTVSVKPLEWLPYAVDGSTLKAKTDLGHYVVWEIGGRGYLSTAIGEPGQAQNGDIDAAKSEAQSRHDARILSALLSAPKPEPVGWETDAEWDLEMRCANITEATPFAEVSKLINDLWQQYCIAAEPKPEAEGVDRQVHPSKPVVSQNTQTVEDNGGADYLPDDIESYFRRQIWWSENTFGPALRTKGVIDHIRKELTEIEREPHDLSEWIDVVILAMDGFWRHGGNASDLLPALLAKQRKNMARVWPDWRTMSEDSAIEHDRSKDASLTAKKTDGRGE